MSLRFIRLGGHCSRDNTMNYAHFVLPGTRYARKPPHVEGLLFGGFHKFAVAQVCAGYGP